MAWLLEVKFAGGLLARRRLGLADVADSLLHYGAQARETLYFTDAKS
jgi:hypothetical protein